jgi:fructose-1,6-bisphosphatase I
LALHITENAPAKFIMQALELAPAKLHDRSPVFLGSYDDVEEIKALYASMSNSG